MPLLPPTSPLPFSFSYFVFFLSDLHYRFHYILNTEEFWSATPPRFGVPQPSSPWYKVSSFIIYSESNPLTTLLTSNLYAANLASHGSVIGLLVPEEYIEPNFVYHQTLLVSIKYYHSSIFSCLIFPSYLKFCYSEGHWSFNDISERCSQQGHIAQGHPGKTLEFKDLCPDGHLGLHLDINMKTALFLQNGGGQNRF